MNEDDIQVPVLIAPSGYELAIPVFNRTFTRLESFIGVDTATAYSKVKVRESQPLESVRVRLMSMSNWPMIVGWFALSQQQGELLTEVSLNWMVGVAKGVHTMGYESESIIDLETANTAIEDEIQEWQSNGNDGH